MTRSTTSLLAVLTIATGFGISSPGFAVTSPALNSQTMERETETEVLSGEIVSLDLSNDQFTIKTAVIDGANNERKVEINDDTIYLLDGKEADRDMVLMKNKRVMVWHIDGVASRIARKENP